MADMLPPDSDTDWKTLRTASRHSNAGLKRADIKTLAVTSPQESLNMLRAVLDNTPGPALDIVLLNAAAAIYVAGVAASLDEGMKKARTVIENGSARARLASLIAASRRPASGV